MKKKKMRRAQEHPKEIGEANGTKRAMTAMRALLAGSAPLLFSSNTGSLDSSQS